VHDPEKREPVSEKSVPLKKMGDESDSRLADFKGQSLGAKMNLHRRLSWT
jgi:hypothetical protein